MKEEQQHIIDLFDKYHRNLLPSADRAHVEKMILENPSHKELFELTKLENLAMEIMLEEDLRQDIKKWQSEDSDQKKASQPPRTLGLQMKHLMAIAAGLAILILSTTWFIRSNSSYDKLFREFYEMDSGLPTLMSNNQESHLFDSGMVEYKIEQFEKAESIWAKLEAQGFTSDTLTYYLGMAHLNQKEYSHAKEKLIKISSNSSFFTNSQWYLALIALKNRDLDSAKSILQTLKQERANDLLEKIQ